MGRTYLFECAKCGYRAQVAGGGERGFQLAVQTVECRDCRALHDVVTELKVPAPIAPKLTVWQLKAGPEDAGAAPRVAAALNQLGPQGQRTRWVRFKMACPVSGFHRIRPWKQPGRCPRCGVFLDSSAIPFKVWE